MLDGCWEARFVLQWLAAVHFPNRRLSLEDEDIEELTNRHKTIMWSVQTSFSDARFYIYNIYSNSHWNLQTKQTHKTILITTIDTIPILIIIIIMRASDTDSFKPDEKLSMGAIQTQHAPEARRCDGRKSHGESENHGIGHHAATNVHDNGNDYDDDDYHMVMMMDHNIDQLIEEANRHEQERQSEDEVFQDTGYDYSSNGDDADGITYQHCGTGGSGIGGEEGEVDNDHLSGVFVPEQDVEDTWEQDDILSLSIEHAVNHVMEYPPLDDQFHIPRDMFLRCCTALKIFTLRQFLYHFGFEETKVFVRMLQERLQHLRLSNEDLEIQTRRLAHELSTLVLRRPVLTISEIDELFHEQKQMVLSIGCPTLDSELLRGGLRTQMITEIFGESSSGKTQIITQLLIQCCLPIEMGGLNGSAMLMFTEGSFAMNRLRQMITEKLKYWKSDSHSMQLLKHYGLHDETSFLDHIFIRDIKTLTEFEMVMAKGVPETIDMCNKTQRNENDSGMVDGSRPIRLIVIDSIASLFRGEFENTTHAMVERSSKFVLISEQLKHLSTKHNICIVVTNQATDKFQDDNSVSRSGRTTRNSSAGISSSIHSGAMDLTEDVVKRISSKLKEKHRSGEDTDDYDGSRFGESGNTRSHGVFDVRTQSVKLPSLGLAWSNCINMRIMVRKGQHKIRVHHADRLESPLDVRDDEEEESGEEYGGSTRRRHWHGHTGLAKRKRLNSGLQESKQFPEELIHRQMHVIFSPYAKTHCCAYVVDTWGVRGALYNPDIQSWSTAISE